MNMEFLGDAINLFIEEVIESGLKRDLEDYASSISQSQNNILQLREMANKLFSDLDHIYGTDLPILLKKLFPKKDLRPFTDEPQSENLRALIEDREIPQPEFFNKLNSFITQLKSKVEINHAEIKKISDFINPYLEKEKKQIAAKKLAIISIIFSDFPTITNFRQFTKALGAWNKILPIYHQLLKSESPEDIQIVEVQNGSIDFIINLNVDVAINLRDICLIGFGAFWAYLKYKREEKPIVEMFHGNKDLISLEEKKEKLLLDNIHDSIKKGIEEQHAEAKKADSEIDKTAIPKKIEQVAKLITSHITKGNDIKFLAFPKGEEATESGAKGKDNDNALRERSVMARREFRILSRDEKQKLLDVYGEIPEVDQS